MVIGGIFGLAWWQLGLITAIYIPVMVCSHMALNKQKEENIRVIIELYKRHGILDEDVLSREEERLKNLDPIDVEIEVFRVKKNLCRDT